MSCPTVESKPAPPAAAATAAAVSVSPEVTGSNITKRMSYPYKKRASKEYEQEHRRRQQPHEPQQRAPEQQPLAVQSEPQQPEPPHPQPQQFEQFRQQTDERMQRAQRYQQLAERLQRKAQQLQQEALQLQQQAEQQQQQQHCPKRPLKKPKRRLKLQPGTVTASGTAVTASGNIPEEAGSSGISRGEAASAELPSQQSREDSDGEEEDEDEESTSSWTESTDSKYYSGMDEEALEAKLACCLAIRVSANKFVSCGRPAFGIAFTNRLRDKARQKNFPFAYNKARGHYYTCLFHYRIIMHEPRLREGETLEQRELTRYLAPEVAEDETQAFKDDPLIKGFVRDYKRAQAAETQDKKKKKKGKATASGGGDAESSDEEAPNLNIIYGLWPFKSGSFHTMKEGEEPNTSASGEGLSTSPPQVPFHSLSATTLRRYKKHFNLPHRSSTNTKQQLLEGIQEHFETINAPSFETVAHFLHIVKTHRNKLDYPAGD